MYPQSQWSPQKLATSNILFQHFSEDQFQAPLGSTPGTFGLGNELQYNFNKFFWMPWPTPYKNKMLATEKVNRILTQKGTTNPVYYDGYWYFLWRKQGTDPSADDFGSHCIEQKHYLVYQTWKITMSN